MPSKAKTKSVPPTKPAAKPAKLPNVWQLSRAAALTLWQYRWLFVGLSLIYGLLNLILVQGLASTDVGGLKDTLNQAIGGHFGGLLSGLGVFVALVGSAGNGSSPTAGAYQLFLVLITSLAIIWSLRQVTAGKHIKLRDAYYRGLYPLVPFILVLLVVGLQLLPLVFGSALYSLVITKGIAVHLVEKLIWALVFAASAIWSFYMIGSSVFALYIVTLPDMTPMKALRSARELVRRRRWLALRKVLFLPLLLLIVAAIIMVPVIIWLTPLARWLFFILTMLSLAAVHGYMYQLYRELLNE